MPRSLVDLNTNEARRPAGSGLERERPAPPLVFVVDDDAATLALLCDVAEDAGWAARGFLRLRDIMAGLERERPDLLILDDDLPDGSGGDLAREIRADPGTHHLPVLVCTAAHPMRQAEIGSWAPVVSKPFDITELVGFFDAAARRNRGAGRGQATG